MFLTNTHELCGLLWFFYQLFGLSFWRHPFTLEDPLVSSDVIQNFSNSFGFLIFIWMGWGWVYLQQILIFGWII